MSQQPPTSIPTIPLPYLLSIPNVYYWKKAFHHIVGTLYIAFDFLYFEGRETTINPMIKSSSSSSNSLKNWSASLIGSSSSSTNESNTNNNSNNEIDKKVSNDSNELSIIILYEHVEFITKENYLLKPCLCIKTNNKDEKHYFYGLESIANTISIIEHASYLSLTSQLACKLIAIKQDRPEVKSHSKLNTKSNSKSNSSKKEKDMSVKDKIEYEKDQMIKLAKKTKEINQDTLNELDYQRKELQETKENYLEPIKAYNSLATRLLTGMSWGGFVKNLWSYSKWKKIEKEALVYRDDIQRERSLDFNSLSFEILIRNSNEKHYESFIAVIGDKTIDLIRDKQTRVIMRQFDYKIMNGMKIVNPFLFEMSFMNLENDLIVLSVFSPFIVEKIRSMNRGLIIQDEDQVLCSSRFDPFKFYSKDSSQLVNISSMTLERYKTVGDLLENDKDAKLDYLYDIIIDIKDISEVTGQVISDSSEFLEDFISEVDDTDQHVRGNIRAINRKL